MTKSKIYTGIDTKHEHGVEVFYAYFRGVLIDEYQSRKEAQAKIDDLQERFKS